MWTALLSNFLNGQKAFGKAGYFALCPRVRGERKCIQIRMSELAYLVAVAILVSK
jgi:hypothetical protein